MVRSDMTCCCANEGLRNTPSLADQQGLALCKTLLPMCIHWQQASATESTLATGIIGNLHLARMCPDSCCLNWPAPPSAHVFVLREWPMMTMTSPALLPRGLAPDGSVLG